VDHSTTINSFGPVPVYRPASVADLCRLVRDTRRAGHGLYPVGGRTTLDYGLVPTKPGVACDTTALAGVIDYPARDMTVTVQAGVPVAVLQAELAKEGQWLPVDVPAPERATLGGAAAVNASGPRRYGYGTLRDYVLGISFVTDDAVEVKAGGRVVKNVAGYDLMKLQIGALGTLGVVTRLTLKVKPKPEASGAVVFGCDTPALAGVLDVLAASRTRPVAVELCNRAAWRAAHLAPEIATDWVLAVGFEEKAAAVRWQVSALRDELRAAPVRDLTELPDTDFCSKLGALQLRAESRFIGKRSVVPSKLAEAVAGGRAALVHAHALTGVIWTHSDDAPPAGAVVRRCPPELKSALGVWGAHPPDWELMRHIKKTLDPDNVFNPGRLFGDS
jgi:glycolate oxidase FAD binding subunit